MNSAKNILILLGVVVVIVFVIFLIAGIKIASSMFLTVLGIVAAIAVIGLVIYLISKARKKINGD